MLELEVGRKLRELEKTLAVAESCTGGLLASRITDVPGSSDYFLGGIVAYSNEVKKNLLGVPEEILGTLGAVSKECAERMAQGARELFGADLSLAITGIAGPGGGTEEKPVGLVYVALATPQGALVRRFKFEGARKANKWSAAEAALGLLFDHLLGRL